MKRERELNHPVISLNKLHFRFFFCFPIFCFFLILHLAGSTVAPFWSVFVIVVAVCWIQNVSINRENVFPQVFVQVQVFDEKKSYFDTYPI